ncbi:MAG: hypothetical protein EPN62_08575 [Candidimonas sp.]|nr:MAG: hypothetical protein EPN77_05810 [Candidimonas sp.]TAM23722.1 MAG: hypothetical protein EPN62_08575 [Candidimonas sp.]
MDIPMTAVALPHSDLSRAKPLLGFDYDGHPYHVLAFDFGDDGGAIGIWRAGDNFCARITLDALAQFNKQARDAAVQQGGQ